MPKSESLSIESVSTSSGAITLPPPIAAYFLADGTNDLEAHGQCFTPDALVTDDGHTYRGIDEIQAWKVESSSKYQATNQPFAVEEKEGKILVTSRVEGNFPGSPIDLKFIFQLSGDKITTLEVTP